MEALLEAGKSSGGAVLSMGSLGPLFKERWKIPFLVQKAGYETLGIFIAKACMDITKVGILEGF